VELLYHITRILADGAPLLFTSPPHASEGLQERWLGNSEMYWSSFSVKWYEITCSDLGLDFVAKSKEVKEFVGEKETTYYLLYRKPLPEKVLIIPQDHSPYSLFPNQGPQSNELLFQEEYKHLFGNVQ